MTGEREIIPSEEIIVHNLPVIAIVGGAGAGKGTACEILRVHFGFPSFSVSSILRELLQADGIPEPYSRQQYRQKHKETVAAYGETAFIRAILQKGLETHSRTPIRGFIVDGPQHATEVEAVKKQPNGFTIALNVQDNTRFERVRQRNRLGDVKTLEEFQALERDEGQFVELARLTTNVAISNQGPASSMEEDLVEHILRRFPNLVS